MPELVNGEQFQRCAEDLIALPGVRAVDVQHDRPDLDRPCIEVVVGPGYERVPPRVLDAVREHDLGLRPDLSGSRGRPRHWVVVVT